MSNTNVLSLIVNGEKVQLPLIPGETLAELLRERLNLTGTKIGCNENECGICTVLVNDEAVLSCNYPAVRAQGKRVLTIEGLNSGDKLHPLQQAFVEYGAVQCGFCIPGQIMTAYALLQRYPSPTPEIIRRKLKDTLCRCAGYPSIEGAILAAGKAMRTGKPIEPPAVTLSSKPLKVIGQVHIRPDAVQKVTGEAKFTDDLKFDGMLHAAVRRAGVPHGVLHSLDVSPAWEINGVAAVLTADDVPGEINHGLVIKDWPALIDVGQKVRYVGDAIAIIAADSREAALRAAEIIRVEIEPLPVVAGPVQAHQADASQLHENGNLLKHIEVRKGEVEEGFAEADVVLEHVYHTATIDHAFLEPECSIARLTKDGRMEVYVGSQIPYADRQQVAQALGWEEDRVRVIGQTMGGGFGGKEDIAGQIHAALLSNATGRPVKLLYDRHESLIAHPKRHATQIRVKLGAKRDGTLTAADTELFGDTGAYASLGEKVMTRATTHSSGPYQIPAVKADCYAMYTNNPPSGAFRGFGVTQSAFAVESMIDRLAEELGIDPVELRRKNALTVGSITNTGQVLRDSVGLLECIDRVDEKMRQLAGAEPFKARPLPNDPKLISSWGFAVAYKNTGLGGGAADKAGAEVELYPDGMIEVRSSSAELGQGLVTVLQMIVAEEFRIAPERVRVLVMDTDLAPDGGPTTASRQTYVTGNAARLAAIALRDAISSTLAEKFNLKPDQVRFEEGLAQVGEQQVPLGKVVSLMEDEGRKAMSLYTYWAPETKPLGQGGDMHFAFSYAAQAAEVSVDTRSGEVKVLRVIAATDVGKAINPLGLRGQIEGGVVMGIGNALT